MKSFPIVEILWTDALQLHSDWMDIKEAKNRTMPSKSVGYLIKESDEAMTVVALVNENHVALGITIPKRMIDEVRYL